MSEQPPSAEDRISLRILAYLKEHPQAKDTMEGISQRWLVGAGTKPRLVELERPLESLYSKKLILSTEGKGLPRCYAVNPVKWQEISKFLRDR
jgi:hypothetical protein